MHSGGPRPGLHRTRVGWSGWRFGGRSRARSTSRGCRTRNQSLPWRSARSRRTRGTQRNRGRPPGERRGPSRRAGPRRPGRSHGRITHAGASPSTTSWTVGGSRPEPGWAWSWAPDLLWLPSSTPWLPSVGIEQVLRTRSRSWPITRDTTGPAHPSRGGVGCRSASESRSGRRGALRFCSSGVMAGRASSSSSSARARRSSGIRPCGAQCSPPPRDGPQARAPGWPAGTPAWRGSHEWSSAVSGAGSPMRSAVDLEPPKSLPTIRESIYGDIDSYAACRPICRVCGCVRRGRCHACWCAVRRTAAQPGPSCHHGPRRPTLIPGEQP